MSQIRCLVPQLVPTVHIAVGGQHAGAAERNELGAGSPFGQRESRLTRDALQFVLVDVSGPLDARTKQTVQQDVARGRCRVLPGQHEYHIKSETGAGGGSEPGMVALSRTDRDQGPRSVGQGRGAGVFEFPDLVAAAAQPGQVIALDPEIVRTKAEGGGEPRRGLERGGPGASV